MNTLSDTAWSGASTSHVDAALLEAVAGMKPGWTVLRDGTLAGSGQQPWGRVRYALLHPEIGIALLDILPGPTTRCAPDRLRHLLATADFQGRFGEYPPIAYLCMPSRTLPDLEGLLAREFTSLPPLALSGGDAWVSAARQVLAAQPLRGSSGRTAAQGPMPPFPPPQQAEGRFSSRLNPGWRGLAVFWGSVLLASSGGAGVLQYLGPPDERSAIARAGNGPGEAHAPQAAGAEARHTTALLPRPDEAWSPTLAGPFFALWPAKPMPTRPDAAPGGAAAGQAGGAAGPVEPRAGRGPSAPIAAAVDEPPMPTATSGHTETHPASLAAASTGVDAAGSSAPAEEIAAGLAEAVDTALPAANAGSESAKAAAAVAEAPLPALVRPRSRAAETVPDRTRVAPGVAAAPPNGGPAAASGAAVTVADAPSWLAGGSPAPARPADSADAPAPAGSNSGEDASIAWAASGPRVAAGTDTSAERARAEPLPPSAAAPVAAPQRGVGAGATELPSESGGRSPGSWRAPPDDPASGAEASPATAGTAAPAVASSAPSVTAVGDASDAVRAPDAEVAAGATASAAGPEAPPSANLGATAPAQASTPIPVGSGGAGASSVAGGQPSLHADPRATATQDDAAVADALTPPEATAESVAVAGEAATDTASRTSEGAAAREGPTPTPAADARATELPAGPRPPAPRTVAAPPDEHAPPVAAGEPVPSDERPSGDMPAVSPPEPSTTPARIGAAAPDTASARGTALGEVSPAPGPDLAATAPSQPGLPAEARGSMEAGVQSSPSVVLAPPHPSLAGQTGRPDAVPVARPGVAPDTGPERGVDPARPAAGVAAPRPMAPEPDGQAPVQTDGTERRIPAAPGSSALTAALVARGDAMVDRRDISAARLLYERAAMAGVARAAAALARTYDPAFLAEVGAHGIRGDAALALAWYRKAAALGDSGARARAEALAGPDGGTPGRP